MLKTLLAAALALFTGAALAAIDINRADQAGLEAVKGIGPVLSQRIIEERDKGAFKDWTDVIRRLRGVGPGNAARFSAGGLTVDGSAYDGATARPATTGSSAPPLRR